MEANQYSFAVDIKTTKDIIKSSIESIFNVKVISVNTSRPLRRTHKVGRFSGHRSQYKKAIVTLAEGYSINLFVKLV